MNSFLEELKAAHAKGCFLPFIRDSAASGILFEAMPELRDLEQVPQNPRWHPEGDVWTHTLLVIENLPPHATFAMSLAALLHDIGKKTKTVILETGAISAKGHEADSEKMALFRLNALGADENLIKDVLFLVRHHMTAHNKDANVKTLRRLVREGGWELVDQLLQHGVADVSGGCREFNDCERLRNLFDNLDESYTKKN